MNNLIGAVIAGRYRVTAQLGEGGMAVVYRATDQRLERDAAIKFIRMDMIAPAMVAETLARFERESKLLASLSHPNIVKVFDYGEFKFSADTPAIPYLIMEMVAGGTLKEHMLHPIDYRSAAHLLIPVAEALAYAHEHNIIHRDVKPANILLTHKGIPMLSDFGIVQWMSADAVTLTQSGMAMGTLGYMAPEQGLGKKVDGRADVYSLGVIFYQLISGHKPFEAETPMAMLHMQLSEPLPPVRHWLPPGVPNLPLDIESALQKMLYKTPEGRYSGMAALIFDLQRIASGAPLSDLRPTATSRTQRIQEGDPTRIADQNYYPPAADRTPHAARPWLWLAIGIVSLILTLLAVVGVVALTGFLRPRPVNAVANATPLMSSSIVAHTPTFTIIPPGAAVVSPPTGTPAPAPVGLPTNAPPPPGAARTWQNDGMVGLYVPAGEFSMGSKDNEIQAILSADPQHKIEELNPELPQHMVYLDAFWIDRTEVTNTMYALFVRQTSYVTDIEKNGIAWVFNTATLQWEQNKDANWRQPFGAGSSADSFPAHPVVQIGWSDARAYCEWAGRRLPSEAEWEKAARGTDGRTYPWGNQPPNSSLLNYADRRLSIGWEDRNADDGYQFTAPVGSYPAGASPYGALDMAGNVWEWTSDWFSETYYASAPAQNPPGAPRGQYRTIRGGSWINDFTDLRNAMRGKGDPTRAFGVRGFRCVWSD